MNEKLKMALVKVGKHFEGYASVRKARKGYDRKHIHETADVWLGDVGELNAIAKTEGCSQTVYDFYMEIIKFLKANKDYSAAKILISRALPILEIHGPAFIEDDLYEGLDKHAKRKHINQYTMKDNDNAELLEAINRFIDSFCDKIIKGIIPNVAPILPENLDDDLPFVFGLPSFAGMIQVDNDSLYSFNDNFADKYCRTLENTFVLLTKAYHENDDYIMEIFYLKMLKRIFSMRKDKVYIHAWAVTKATFEDKTFENEFFENVHQDQNSALNALKVVCTVIAHNNKDTQRCIKEIEKKNKELVDFLLLIKARYNELKNSIMGVNKAINEANSLYKIMKNKNRK